MSRILEAAISSCNDGIVAFSKFITANDTGSTGGHQFGFHISKSAWPLFFDKPGVKGQNLDSFVKINWQNDFETDSRFIYYGAKTRNEYRLTRFGRGFPFLQDENVGDLLVIVRKEERIYDAFVLSSDEDIEGFFSAFGISSTETNKILPKSTLLSAEERLTILFQEFIAKLEVDFPSTHELSNGARMIFFEAFGLNRDVVLRQPDSELLNWISTEFDLFKAIENNRYEEIIRSRFPSVDELIKTANTILNRRKSRAGRSLEHHLSEIFNIWRLSYTSQGVTEENKKPDFIFPNIDAYHSENYGSRKLVFLGAKTTCKDRWRQIIGEADKIPHKHLFTLQQGISENQLREMKSASVTLVVPKPYLNSFPKSYREDILTLDQFVKHVLSTQ